MKKCRVADEFKMQCLTYSGEPRKDYKRKVTFKKRSEGLTDFSYKNLCVWLCVFVSLCMFEGCGSGDAVTTCLPKEKFYCD